MTKVVSKYFTSVTQLLKRVVEFTCLSFNKKHPAFYGGCFLSNSF